MPSHKETNAFIKRWNKHFAIKGYSKMNITEKNKLVESKVKELKEKSIGEYKKIQDEWNKLKGNKPAPAPAPAPKKAPPKKTDRARPSRLEKKDRPAVIDLRTKKAPAPKKAGGGETHTFSLTKEKLKFSPLKEGMVSDGAGGKVKILYRTIEGLPDKEFGTSFKRNYKDNTVMKSAVGDRARDPLKQFKDKVGFDGFLSNINSYLTNKNWLKNELIKKAPAPKKEEPKKEEPKKDKPSETIAVIQGSNQDINLTYQEMIDAVNRSMSDKKQRKLFNEKKKELKESLEERLSDKVLFTQMEQRAFDDSFERNYLGLDGKNAGEQIKKYLKLYKTAGLESRILK